MERIEIQEIIDVCEEGNSEYLKLYRPLLGYDDEVILYRGIDDSMEGTLNEIEAKVGIVTPADFLQIYLLANGGRYFDVTLYYLTNDKEDKKGLYYNNFNSSLRSEYNIPDNTIIIGETTDNELILVGIDEENYYYYFTWDKETKEMNVDYNYLVEILAYEIDYHTQAFSIDENVEEES